MERIKNTYTVLHAASAVLMILALLWLTISIPFVYATQQELVKQHKLSAAVTDITIVEEEAGSPLGNSTEEKKCSNGNSLSEEYLHHHHIEDLFISPIAQFHKSEMQGTYNAFHGEVHVPPPNAA